MRQWDGLRGAGTCEPALGEELGELGRCRMGGDSMLSSGNSIDKG